MSSWTPEETEKCKELLRSGSSCREAGLAVGRSKNSVAYKNQNEWFIDLSSITSTLAEKYRNTPNGSTKLPDISATRGKCRQCGNPCRSRSGLCIRCKRPLDASKTLPQRQEQSEKRRQIRRAASEQRRIDRVLEGNKLRLEGVLRFIDLFFSGRIHLTRYTFTKIYGILRLAFEKLPCEACGFASMPIHEMHHIKPRSSGGLNEINNLSWLCPNCHTAVHKGFIECPDITKRSVDVESVVEYIKQQFSSHKKHNLLKGPVKTYCSDDSKYSIDRPAITL